MKESEIVQGYVDMLFACLQPNRTQPEQPEEAEGTDEDATCPLEEAYTSACQRIDTLEEAVASARVILETASRFLRVEAEECPDDGLSNAYLLGRYQARCVLLGDQIRKAARVLLEGQAGE